MEALKKKSGRVLIIAGSDSGGGAGIQADIKTVTALSGFAMTAVTALTAQNTVGVHAVHEVPSDFVKQQMESVIDDIGADSIKIGMLHRAEIIETVEAFLIDKAGQIPLVLDPVMVAKGGALLLKKSASSFLEKCLLPLADLITPNVPEAAVLSGIEVKTIDDAIKAAGVLRQKGAQGILMKGGHFEGDDLVDLLFQDDGPPEVLAGSRIHTRNTHGTGCTLASACAVGLAQGLPLKVAVQRAHAYVRVAIKTAPGFGTGHGPLNHANTVNQF